MDVHFVTAYDQLIKIKQDFGNKNSVMITVTELSNNKPATEFYVDPSVLAELHKGLALYFPVG